MMENALRSVELAQHHSLSDFIAASEGKPWGAVLRALLPWWKLENPGLGTSAQRALAAILCERAGFVAALSPSELVAVFTAGGRPALYELCVEGAGDPRIKAALARLDAGDAEYDRRMALLSERAECAEKASNLSITTFSRYGAAEQRKLAAFIEALEGARKRV